MPPLMLMIVFLLTSAAGMSSSQVTTRSGRVRGRYVQTRDGRTVMAFLGVPFAKPPVGSLRFEPPQPVDSWRHELLAVSQPPPCLQILDPLGSEDCLYLNIYTPDTDESNQYPVMVFFYGGSLEYGAANQFTHEFFLDEDVILVVVQYRLGLFGKDEIRAEEQEFTKYRIKLLLIIAAKQIEFTCWERLLVLHSSRQLPNMFFDIDPVDTSKTSGFIDPKTIRGIYCGFLSTGDEVVPGNMGLKDMRCALRWLQDNVRCFGGDPHRVTIMGQSAGAAGLHSLMLFAAHEKLFWAGISESGSATETSLFRPPAEIKKMVSVLAGLSACPRDSRGFVECLKSRPGLEILNLYSILYKNLMYPGLETVVKQLLPLIGAVIESECVEDRLITDNPWQVNTSIPWLVGANSKETLFLLVAEVNDRTNALFLSLNEAFNFYFPQLVFYQFSQADGSGVPEEFRKFYLDSLPISRATLGPFVDGLSDAVFVYAIYEAIMRANKEKTYVYYFDYLGKNQFYPIPYDARVGASHTDELWFLYPHVYSALPNRQDYFDKDDNMLSRTLVKMWTNFGSCLDPTPGDFSNVRWESFSEEERFLHITQSGMFMDQPFLPDRMAFWRSQPFPFRNDHFDPPSCSYPNGTAGERQQTENNGCMQLKNIES